MGRHAAWSTAGWVDASSRPEQPFLRPGRLPSTITTHAGFGYHWWPVTDDGSRVMADGMRGQFVYVDRPRRTVVVKTSAWPYEDAVVGPSVSRPLLPRPAGDRRGGRARRDLTCD